MILSGTLATEIHRERLSPKSLAGTCRVLRFVFEGYPYVGHRVISSRAHRLGSRSRCIGPASTRPTRKTWRYSAESNCGTRFCRPPPNHSVTASFKICLTSRVGLEPTFSRQSCRNFYKRTPSSLLHPPDGTASSTTPLCRRGVRRGYTKFPVTTTCLSNLCAGGELRYPDPNVNSVVLCL